CAARRRRTHLSAPPRQEVLEGGPYELACSHVRAASPSRIARVFFGENHSTPAELAGRPRGPASARGARRGHRMGRRLSVAEGLTGGTCACSSSFASTKTSSSA